MHTRHTGFQLEKHVWGREASIGFGYGDTMHKHTKTRESGCMPPRKIFRWLVVGLRSLSGKLGNLDGNVRVTHSSSNQGGSQAPVSTHGVQTDQ